MNIIYIILGKILGNVVQKSQNVKNALIIMKKGEISMKKIYYAMNAKLIPIFPLIEKNVKIAW